MANLCSVLFIKRFSSWHSNTFHHNLTSSGPQAKTVRYSPWLEETHRLPEEKTSSGRGHRACLLLTKPPEKAQCSGALAKPCSQRYGGRWQPSSTDQYILSHLTLCFICHRATRGGQVTSSMLTQYIFVPTAPARIQRPK